MKYLYKLYVKIRFGRLSYGRVAFVEADTGQGTGYVSGYEVVQV